MEQYEKRDKYERKYIENMPNDQKKSGQPRPIKADTKKTSTSI